MGVFLVINGLILAGFVDTIAGAWWWDGTE